MKTHTHTYTDTQPLPAKTHHPPSTAQIRFQSWLAVALDHTVIPSAVVANYSGALFGRCQCLVWTLPVPCLDRAGCLFEPCWCLVWTLPVPCLDLAGALFGPCRCLVWTFPGPCLDLASLCGKMRLDLAGALFGPCRCLAWTLPVPCLDLAGALCGPRRCLVWTLPVPCLDLAGALSGPCVTLRLLASPPFPHFKPLQTQNYPIPARDELGLALSIPLPVHDVYLCVHPYICTYMYALVDLCMRSAPLTYCDYMFLEIRIRHLNSSVVGQVYPFLAIGFMELI